MKLIATEAMDIAAAGNAASTLTGSGSKMPKSHFHGKLPKQLLNQGSEIESATDSEMPQHFAENDEWAKKLKNDSITPSPTGLRRPTVPGRKRDLIILQSALSPKYIGYANANSPTIVDSDDTKRTTRRRTQATIANSSFEIQSEDSESTTVQTPKSLTSAQLLAGSRHYLSPIDKLLIKNGANSPNSTGFEADAEDVIPQRQRKLLKRRQKRVSKAKSVSESKIENACEAPITPVRVKSVESVKTGPADTPIKVEAPEIATADEEAFPNSKIVEPSNASIVGQTKPEAAAKASPRKSTIEIDPAVVIKKETDNFQENAIFTEPTKTSTEFILNVSAAMKSPPNLLENSSITQPEADNSIKSPSSISIDSAKGLSIVTDAGWPAYQVGDLYWGQLFSYCYWPCMICPDPDGQIVGTLPTHPQRKSTDNAPFPIQVHVRFFADNGRRNWIKQENLLPFAGLKVYEDQREEIRIKFGPKSLKFRQMVPKKTKLTIWHKAINEAQIVGHLPYPERLEKFYQLYEEAEIINKQKRKRTNSMLHDTRCSTSDVGSSLYDSTDNLYARPLHQALKRERSESPFRPSFSPVKHNHEFRAKRRKLSSNVAGTDANQVPFLSPQAAALLSDDAMFRNAEFVQLFEALKEFIMVHGDDAKVEKCILAVVRNIWSLKLLRLRELERELAIKENEALGSSIIERGNGVGGAGSIKRLSHRLRDIVRRSMTPILTPTTTPAATPTPMLIDRTAEAARIKKPVNRPIDEVVNDILNLDHKYLFKGVSREPVCKYCCEPGGNIQRCSKNCNTWLHAVCLELPSKVASASAAGKKTTKALQARQDFEMKPAPLADADSLSSPSPVSDAELMSTTQHNADVTNEAVAPVICNECASHAPDICCICHKDAPPASPPASPLKGSVNDELPTTSAAAAAALAMRDPDKLIACNQPICGKKFHPSCCKYWPQAKITKSISRCPMHVCHTCVSDDPRGKFQQLSNTKLTKCVKCPATYHIDSHCIPAGSRILTTTHMICPRHNVAKSDAHVNVLWCYICVKGGELVCCETCPIAVHAHCRNIPIKTNENYICEECESGRLPLYGEIVWAKFNNFRWWPAIILPPTEVPSNLLKKPHGVNDFVVRFFGTHDHGWISRRRVYLYIEGDAGDTVKQKSQLQKSYSAGVEEASRFLKIIKDKRMEQTIGKTAGSKLHPQPYVRIKANKPVHPIRFVFNSEDVSVCECNPTLKHPCGPETGCLNRMLYHECNPDFCFAGNRCENQMFEMRKSPRLEVVYMNERGFGLVCREAISEGTFIVEYVGEVINHAEFLQRMLQKARDRDENYYFLEVEKDFIIDAGPKGNLARFMNHSCEPNCETQKWSVNAIHRVGLFAIKDIPPNTELTFNYHWDDLMNNSKKVCFCGATRCSGTIGGKLKEETTKEATSLTKIATKLKSLKRLQHGKSKPPRIQIKRPKEKTKKQRKPKIKDKKHISADDTQTEDVDEDSSGSKQAAA